MSLIKDIFSEVFNTQKTTLEEHSKTEDFQNILKILKLEAEQGNSSVILPTLPKKSRELLVMAGFEIKDFPKFTEQVSWRLI